MKVYALEEANIALDEKRQERGYHKGSGQAEQW